MFCIGWLIGSIGLNIHSMSADTLLHCFLVEEDMHKIGVKGSSNLPEMRDFLHNERNSN
jgi:hypothetical protein